MHLYFQISSYKLSFESSKEYKLNLPYNDDISDMTAISEMLWMSNVKVLRSEIF